MTVWNEQESAESGFGELEREERESTFCIQHYYDIGDQRIYVREGRGCTVNARRAAIYCQFKCEEWFGSAAQLSNFGVAAMLIAFYRFDYAQPTEGADVIDLYYDRERACGDLWREMMADTTLARDGLRDAMRPFVEGVREVNRTTLNVSMYPLQIRPLIRGKFLESISDGHVTIIIHLHDDVGEVAVERAEMSGIRDDRREDHLDLTFFTDKGRLLATIDMAGSPLDEQVRAAESVSIELTTPRCKRVFTVPIVQPAN